MATTSNLAVLTRSHHAIHAKKRAKRDQVKEVVFDDTARREFLTGFHKRKLAKAEAARSKAKEREKQERLEARREQRRMLREQALENAAQVEKAYGALIDGDAEEWDGIGSSSKPLDELEHDEEYEDEEMLATVTVVEDFDPDTIIHGPAKPESTPSSVFRPDPKLSLPKSTPRPNIKKKFKEKKIRYETKDARRRESTKQRARKTEKAELAGGKASRKHKSPRGAKGKHSSRR